MSLVRVRQHVNPLSEKYRQPAPLPDWKTVYADPTRPMHLDIGCGRGLFLLDMAAALPDWNFLGLEIRQPLVEQASQWQAEAGATNLHFLYGSANSSLQPLLKSLGTGVLQRVSIQFPDPWFKRRHQKRRVVQPEMVEVIAQHLAIAGTVILQSDVQGVATEMCDRFAAHPAFIRQNTALDRTDSPMPVQTEREKMTLEKGASVYRAIFSRASQSL